MRKMIVFCPLGNGGTEVALRELLKRIDPTHWDITLASAEPNGPMRSQIPDYVTIVPITCDSVFSRVQNCLNLDSVPKIKIFACKVLSKILKYVSGEKHDYAYEYAIRSMFFEGKDHEYDLVVDFMGYGKPYTALAASIRGRRHVTWIHDEDMWWLKYTRPFLASYDTIYCVSKAAQSAFVKICPEYADKTKVFYNFIDEQRIINLAKFPVRDPRYVGDFKILTIGRLMEQKGIDVAIDAARILKDKGVHIQWYVLGEGQLRSDLEVRIREVGVDDCFHLLGQVENPYCYLNECDVYAQPSRSEGYGLAIAEARILGKPIVASDLSPIREQITTGVDGFLVELSAENFADIIFQYYFDQKLLDQICGMLKSNKKTTSNSSKKMLEELLTF